MNFSTPDLSDKRIEYASRFLEKNGLFKVDNPENADFILVGVNPDKHFLNYSSPIFAGNVTNESVTDYTKEETFAIKNAYLTAEAAIALAVNESEHSLINSNVLIAGYGRIGKALHRYLSVYTGNITVCARSETARALAGLNMLLTMPEFNFIFNTIPHPVFNEKELERVGSALLIDLASFPGGVDMHFAKAKGVRLITARGLPSKFSPESAGAVIGETVLKLIKEG